MDSVKHNVAKHEETISRLEEEVKTLKLSDNHHKQQLRSLTILILNLPQIPAEKDDLRGRIYDLLRPLLNAANLSKDLPSVPQAPAFFDAVFRPYQGEQGKAPPLSSSESRAEQSSLLCSKIVSSCLSTT